MNGKFGAALFAFALCTLFAAPCSHAEGPSHGMPSAIDHSAKYLFFLHNYYVEMKGPDGDCKYHDILKSFAEKGFAVISEIRPKNTSVVEYAEKTAADVRKLLDAGVSPYKITLAGHSKGAVIAIRVASLLRNPKISYVIMAGCGIRPLEKAYPDHSLLQGDILSVYATSDKIAGSCATVFSQSKQGISIKEIALENPEGHRLFFKPTDVWLKPVLDWLARKK